MPGWMTQQDSSMSKSLMQGLIHKCDPYTQTHPIHPNTAEKQSREYFFSKETQEYVNAPWKKKPFNKMCPTSTPIVGRSPHSPSCF